MTHIQIELFTGIQKVFQGPELLHQLGIFRYTNHNIFDYTLTLAYFFTRNLLHLSYTANMQLESLSEWHMNIDSRVTSCTSKALWYLIKKYSPHDPHHATHLFICLFRFMPTTSTAKSMNIRCDLKEHIKDYFTNNTSMLTQLSMSAFSPSACPSHTLLLHCCPLHCCYDGMLAHNQLTSVCVMVMAI